MMKKMCALTALILLFLSFFGCGAKEVKKGSDDNKVIQTEAEIALKEEIIAGYERMGLKIVDHEITAVEMAAEVPYNDGGTFKFYEIGYNLQPESKEKVAECEKSYHITINLNEEGLITREIKAKGDEPVRLFISAYEDEGKRYEFRHFIGDSIAEAVRGGKYNQEAFENTIKYIYEDGMQAMPELEEYSFVIDKNPITIGQNTKGKFPLKDAKTENKTADEQMNILAGFREIHKSHVICAETYGYFENKYEPITGMFTLDSQVKTKREIKVGSTKEELFEAYGAENMVFSSKSFGGESFSGFAQKEGLISQDDEWTCFGFKGDDETQNYLAFYMKEGAVSAIEIATGWDYKPFAKEKSQYPLETEAYIEDHIDEPEVMKYDVSIPKIKASVPGSESMNNRIHNDFEKIIGYSETGTYEPDEGGFTYPYVQIGYSISNIGEVAVLNITGSECSALGSGVSKSVKSYYYDTSCGARLSEEAALYKMGYPKELIEQYFAFLHPDVLKDSGAEAGKFENITLYFDVTGEPAYIINGYS